MKKRSQQPSLNYLPQEEAVESKVTATVDVPITQATGANLRAQIESWLLKDIADRHVSVQLAGFQVQDIMFNRATVSVTYTGNEAEVTEYIQQLGAPITNVGSKKVAIRGHVCDNCNRSLSQDDYVGIGSWSYTCPFCFFTYDHNSNMTAEEQVRKFNGEGQDFEIRSSRKKSWRQALGAAKTPNKDFKPYKGDTQTFPGSAEFKGDEFPSKGDSAKKELEAWKEGNSLMQSDKKSDDSQVEHGSPLLSEKVKRYDVLKHNKEEHVLPKYANKKSFWRKVLSFGFGGDTGIDSDFVPQNPNLPFGGDTGLDADSNPPKYDYIGEPVSYHGRAGVVDLPEDEFGMVEIKFDDTGEVEAVDANELREQEFGGTPEILGPTASQKTAGDIHIVKCPFCGFTDHERKFLPGNGKYIDIGEQKDYYCPNCNQEFPSTADSTYPLNEDEALFSSKKSWREKLSYITHEDSGYMVRSEKGKKLRKHPTTKEKATKQLQAIEINKHKKGALKQADISFQNRPDGTVKIDVTSHPNEPLTQNPNTQQPPPMSPEQVQNQQVEETSEKKSALKKKIASEDYEALAKDYGVIFKGIQKDFNNPASSGFPMFEDPATKSTFLLRPDETLSHAITRHQMAFQLHPKKSNRFDFEIDEPIEGVKRIIPDTPKWHKVADTIARIVATSYAKPQEKGNIREVVANYEIDHKVNFGSDIDLMVDYVKEVLRMGSKFRQASDSKKEVTMPAKEFFEEHKHLIPTLEHGTQEQRQEEAKEQKEEVKDWRKKLSWVKPFPTADWHKLNPPFAAFKKALADLHVIGEDLQRKESSCSDNPIESWFIRKDGNLALIGKQCKTHCGIFIEKDGKVVKGDKLEKTANNLTWRELINQAEWEAEYEKYLNQK